MKQKQRPHVGTAMLLLPKEEEKYTCVIRESNPGLYRGRVLFYH